MKRLLEIRTYRLKPGTLDDFHRALMHRAVEVVEGAGLEAVGADFEEAGHEASFAAA